VWVFRFFGLSALWAPAASFVSEIFPVEDREIAAVAAALLAATGTGLAIACFVALVPVADATLASQVPDP
jgi:MFS family permease